MSQDKGTAVPCSGSGATPVTETATPCPECVYWNQCCQIDYNGPDSKFVTSTQISPVSVAFRLDANLGAGNIVITSIFKWGTIESGITDAEKAETIKQFKAKVADWGNRYNIEN